MGEIRLNNGELQALWRINFFEQPKLKGPNPHIDWATIHRLHELRLIRRFTIAESNDWYRRRLPHWKYRCTKKGHRVLQRYQWQAFKQLLDSQQAAYWAYLRRAHTWASLSIQRARKKERISPTKVDYSGVVDSFYHRAEECERTGYSMAV